MLPTEVCYVQQVKVLNVMSISWIEMETMLFVMLGLEDFKASLRFL